MLSRIGEFAEVITEEGYDGEFFVPGDTTALANAIADLLDNDQRRREMGMNNYMAACGLPISDVVDWYLLHFEEIIAERRRGTKSKPPVASELSTPAATLNS